MRNTPGILLASLLALVATPAARATNVVISEIMYFPASGNLQESYVELYNADTVTADLSGWAFTKGLQFSFPANTLLAPGAYLVVAADATAFGAKYPGVTNFLAGWVPPMGAHLVLADAGGNVVNEVHYSNDGDWAVRYLGASIYAHRGWEWSAPYDGAGASLELINLGLPNSYALNWGPSSVMNGTPGRANSIAQTNVAPFVSSVTHSPVVPRPTDVVTVSARITDEHTNGMQAILYYRDATTTNPPAFTATAMFDDGAHNDGLASDGIYAAILPAQPAGTVIEFYLQARDLEGHLRTYPNVLPPANSLRTANLLYQVDTGIYTGSQPLYRIVMTEMERAEIYAIGRQCPDSDSDAQMNATWITTDGVNTGGTTTQVRYNTGVRNRGHGTRQSNPNNYHVNIPGDRPWKNLTGINLNSQYTHNQVVGSAVFRRLEIPMAESRAVQVRINSTNLMSLPGLPDNNSFGCYAANEQYNNDFVQRAFALDPLGNSYRGIRDSVLCYPTNGAADLTWQGANYAVTAYTNAYFKENNLLINDWSDLIDLIAVLNSTNGYQAANYVSDVQRRIDVDEWMRYMAVNTLLDNGETCLANGTGDDYALYRGTLDTRFQALPYDLDTVMGRGLNPVPPRHSIFRMNALSVMARFMQAPALAPSYYRWLKTCADTAFSPAQMNPLLDQLLNSFVPQGTIDTMKAFNAAQVSYVLSQIPLTLTVSTGLAVQSGYPHTTTPSVTLSGTANAIDTRTVLVNGWPASWVAWQGTWSAANVPLNPGINRLLVQSLDTNGVAFAETNVDVWYDNGSVTTVGGTIGANTNWTAAGGPYSVTSSLTIASGATLIIQPGACVYLGSGVNLVVANGGQLLAEGTSAAPIRFTVAPGSGVSWGGLTINGVGSSPENRIAYAFFEANGNTCIEVAGGTLYLDHATFGTTSHQYLSLDSSSFLVSSCVFPTGTTGFELVHGTGGIKAGGRGIVRDCFFGSTIGYNDVMDFTGGNRDLGQPIIQYYNNVFSGSSDDGLDLDGTDAWVEHNIFLHIHRNGAPDSSAAISGGNNDFGSGGGGVRTSEVTALGNLFFDCDNAATAKQGNFFTYINNTMVHTTKTGGLDFASGVVNVRDTTPSLTTFGLGFYLEGNVILDAEQLVRNYDPAQTTVTLNNNILPYAWNGPGTNNVIADPLLRHVPQVAETAFSTWEQAQVLWDWFSLQPGSPARGSGPNGRDRGGVIPIGASIAGEPPATNNQTTATLTVGIVRSGNGIPAASWPNGAGYIDYKWRLDSGVWSAQTPTTTPIALSGLANGPHHVEVSGLRDSGWYQDDPAFGPDTLVTTSHTWTVNTSYVPPALPTVRLNEILALNSTTLTNAGTTPDLIELYNYGAAPVDLSGMGLTDNAILPHKYTFPNGTLLLGPGQFLVLYADSATGAPGIHLGFNLNGSGQAVYLHDKSTSGGALLDSVVFGVQIPDLSLGRGADGTWVLCKPTIGTNNLAVPLDDPHSLKINEWLTSELFLARNDFIELYNPATRPVALGGLYLSDAEGAPGLSPIPALSFIAANGYASFTADGDTAQGADHLNFKLDAEVGIIILSDPALTTIDAINYGPQQTDVAQGRSPSGSDTLVNFAQPTPGSPNPTPNGTITVTNVSTLTLKLLTITNSWKYSNSGGTNFGTTWIPGSYDDSAWSSGTGLFGYETTPSVYPYPFNTYVPPPDTNSGKITVYYRTHFQWNAGLTNVTLLSTNYIDDGAVYYLNGAKVGSLRMPATFTYNTFATNQPNEGLAELLSFATNSLVTGDNVMAVEVHQTGTTSSDGVFGMLLSAIQVSTNVITSAVGVPVVLNEVLASNRTLTNLAGSTSDWVELFNPATNTVSLADFSLSDDPNTPRKFVFAPGTALSPGAYFLLYCNNNLPGASTNTGFSLGATGGSLYFFSSPTNGGGLIDSLTYGFQTPDVSIGRVPNGSGDWILTVPSPASPNTAAGLGDASSLIVNEWMADPVTGSDWFELFNSGTQPVSLGGLFFTDDLTKKTLSPIPPLSFIGAGGNGFVQFLADSQLGAGPNHVNFKLSKSGDSVALLSPDGTLITAVRFGAQQTGVSQGRFPDGSINLVSFTTTVSPARRNFLPLSNVVVNEVLSHSDAPLEDAVELYNPTAAAVDLSGWFVSNSQDDLKAYRLADGMTLPAHGFKVLYEYQFNPTNGSSIPFNFNSAHGDQAWLSQADASGNLTGYRAFVTFGAAANGVSFGRYTNSIGEVDFVAMSAHTFGRDNPSTVEDFRTGTGAPNAYPLVGPVVINELMYDPPSQDGIADNIQDEYVELLNLSPSAVPLYDPAAPTNSWAISGGIAYTFPLNVLLPAGGCLLLVSFDPVIDQPALAEFLSRYQLTNPVSLFGPYSGHLANSGESIALYRPDFPQLPPHPDAGFVPYILLDQINYSATSPWPVGASGTGSSLQRLAPASYGNDPANWFVGAPTAAHANTTNPLDTNGDGLPDAWQIQYFGAISSPSAKPDADADHDGFNNLQEYLAGTDPTDSNSYLKLDSVEAGPTNSVISFKAVAGKTYTVLSSSNLFSGWSKLADVAAQVTTGVVTVPDPSPALGTARFYRLVTPAQP